MPTPVCEECGAPVTAGDAFCGACGAFLAWEDEGGQDPPAPPPSTPAPAAQATPTAAPTAAPALPTAAPTTADPVATSAPTVATTATPTPTGPMRDTPADEEAGRTDQPQAVQPGRPVARRPTVRGYTDNPDTGPDALRCPACGATNKPDRRLCRRCGAALTTVTTPTSRPPWWRRWRLPRHRRGLGLLGRLLTWLLVLALLAGLGYGALVLGRRATDAVRDRLAQPQPVHPVSVRASSELPEHPAASVVDGLSNRYWAPAAAGPATGENVELSFATPFRLLDLLVHAGAGPEEEVFLGQARPAQLELTAWTRDGREAHTTLRLADRSGPQKFHWAVTDVVRVRVTIAAVYGDAPGRRVAVGEIEFFKRP